LFTATRNHSQCPGTTKSSITEHLSFFQTAGSHWRQH